MRAFLVLAIGFLCVGCTAEVKQVSSTPAQSSADVASPAVNTTTVPETNAAETPAASDGGTASAEATTAAGAATTDAAGKPAEATAAGTDAGLTPVAIESGVVTLRPENTRIQFVGTHIGPKPDPRTGVFKEFTGKAEVDAEQKVLKSVAVEIKTESLETSIPKLTNHLRSPDFFDTREQPSAKFQSTAIKAAEDGKYVITGNLTLLKTTKEVQFPAKVAINDKGLTLSADFTIDRTEFGMNFGEKQVHKQVAMTIAIGQSSSLK